VIPSPLSVSVILPVYNRESYLAEAIDSVFRQEYGPLELIVIDDGSTDRTAEIAQGYGEKIRYRYQNNAGAPAARNNGLSVASGNVIAFIDADDLWPEGKLLLQTDRLRQDPTLEVVMGRVQYSILRQTPNGDAIFSPFQSPFLAPYLGAAIYRRTVFEKLGYLNQTYRFCDDVDLFLRIREQRLPMIVMDATTLIYRIHDTNMTRERQKSEADYLKALRQSIDRRRMISGNQQPGSLPALNKES
jgi:glycosyltransferase involved in cell wall biosynthesis